ncbi:hypothetical protein [Actinoplanes xinjiangensis]|uniref:hypothetical protein n=1 Tax=Actinoplanes xinjiangensis TaxID=512350 RepID=UPI0011B4F964|nr:hypothetical protein [Actinoplanes xinjiangensis]GIF42929.1 hypothetical protein Axi01nite_72400 [Actinoplanes xinjiangensis]
MEHRELSPGHVPGSRTAADLPALVDQLERPCRRRDGVLRVGYQSPCRQVLEPPVPTQQGDQFRPRELGWSR